MVQGQQACLLCRRSQSQSPAPAVQGCEVDADVEDHSLTRPQGAAAHLSGQGWPRWSDSVKVNFSGCCAVKRPCSKSEQRWSFVVGH